jgi:hypothetical protein
VWSYIRNIYNIIVVTARRMSNNNYTAYNMRGPRSIPVWDISFFGDRIGPSIAI